MNVPFQPEPGVLRWKLFFRSPPAAVYAALATAEGRQKYWAESAPEHDGVIHFHVPGGLTSQGRILERTPERRFVTEYFGWTVAFDLRPEEGGRGTDLFMVCTNVPENERMEVAAGWVSVLMCMKAAVDHGVDLRNHDENRSWWQGYADN
jgi:uncharacterized protein YndB with AHSA1/START domain